MPQIAPLRTSETWLMIIAAVAQALVRTNVIPAELEPTINAASAAVLPIVFQTIFKKARAGRVAFIHPSS